MIKENYQRVLAAIDEARSRRTVVPKELPVKLIAVTKNHDVAAMREAIDAGASDIGENRIQEAKAKFEMLDRQVTRHLIGHLQTNKARQAVKYFDLIHSVDSLHLAEALEKEAEKQGKLQDILLQVNLAREESKSGLEKEQLLEVFRQVDEFLHLRIRGLMCMAPNSEDVEMCRPLFREMHGIYQQVKGMPWHRAKVEYLSMGMSHDYEIAVEEGANIVRVGTAIFGPRQY